MRSQRPGHEPAGAGHEDAARSNGALRCVLAPARRIDHDGVKTMRSNVRGGSVTACGLLTGSLDCRMRTAPGASSLLARSASGPSCSVRDAYTWRLDFVILLYTVLVALHLKRPLRPSQVNALMRRLAAEPAAAVFDHPAIVADKEAAD